MTFCTKCGAQLDDSAKFCPQCGTAVMSAETPQPAPVPVPEQQAPVQPQYVQQPVQQPQYTQQPVQQPQYQQPVQPQYQQPIQQQYAQQPMPQMQYGQPVPQYAGIPQDAPKKKKTGLVVTLIIIFSLLIAGGVAFFVFFNPFSDVVTDTTDFIPSVESYFSVSQGIKPTYEEFNEFDNIVFYAYAFSPDDLDAVNGYFEYIAGGKYDVRFYEEPDEYNDKYYYSFEYTGDGDVYSLYGQCIEAVILDLRNEYPEGSSKPVDMIVLLIGVSKDLNYGNDGSRSDVSVTDKTSELDDDVMTIVINWFF